MSTCFGCRTPLTPDAAYYYVDESNGTVTANSGAWCYDCYGKRFGHRKERVTEFDLYRQEAGVLGVHNLLLSGDYANREPARARFRVVLTPNGSRVETI